MTLIRNPTRRLGVALGPKRVVAVLTRRTATGWRLEHRVERPAHALTDALRALASSAPLPATGGVALVPPLGSTKIVAVPRLGRRDLALLIQRNTRRFFLAADGPLIADAVPVAAPVGERSAAALAVCTDEATVEQLERSMAAAGVALTHVTTAPLALSEGVRTLVGRSGRRRIVIIVADEPWVEALVIERGIPTAVEPLRVAASPTETRPSVTQRGGELAVSVRNRGEPGRIVVVGDPSELAQLKASLTNGDGTAPLASLPEWAAEDSHTLSAFGASLPAPDAPHLLRAPARETRRRRATHRMAVMGVLTTLLLVAAALVDLWGLARRADALAEHRRAIDVTLGDARARLRAIEALRAQLSTLAEARASRVPWSVALGELGRALPRSAHVTALQGQNDRIRMSGAASSASATVPTLEGALHFSDVRLLSTTRPEGARGPERFEMELRVVPDSSGRSQIREPESP